MFPGGVVPYGYRRVGDRLRIDKKASANLRDFFRLVADGVPLMEASVRSGCCWSTKSAARSAIGIRSYVIGRYRWAPGILTEEEVEAARRGLTGRRSSVIGNQQQADRPHKTYWWRGFVRCREHPGYRMFTQSVGEYEYAMCRRGPHLGGGKRFRYVRMNDREGFGGRLVEWIAAGLEGPRNQAALAEASDGELGAEEIRAIVESLGDRKAIADLMWDERSALAPLIDVLRGEGDWVVA